MPAFVHCRSIFFFFCVLVGLAGFIAHAELSSTVLPGDFHYEFSGLFKPEMFYGKNLTYLNDTNCPDHWIYWRHTLDLNFDAAYGAQTFGHDVIEFYFTVRDRAIWGNPRSIAQTTPAVFKVSESIVGPHNHYLPRNIFWIREAWLMWDIADVLHLKLPTKHTFTIGAFSFELGRGIALGNAYGTGPELLGFYTDTAIDQFAFGAKVNGWIQDKVLSYDIYTAILQNKSNSLGETGERIRGQEYGHLNAAERGYGIVNFIVAGKVDWKAIDCKNSTLTIEPYWLYDYDPEQRVEILGDANSVLGSIGLASEYEGERFAWGFDYASNLGHQNVKGIDRNVIIIKNIQGTLTEINSKVIYSNPTNPKDPQNKSNIPYIPGGAGQTIINDSSRAEVWNGQPIGVVQAADYGYLTGPVYLQNASDRFRDPYRNDYRGWMFVTDAALKAHNGDLQVAATAGIASGDDNPNFATKDRRYDGFFGLQEIYSGKRVRSAYILGSRKLRRPLSFPINYTGGPFAQYVSEFTDLRFVGGAITYKHDWGNGCKIYAHPSIISYWKDWPFRAYNVDIRRHCSDFAELYEGTELNLFIDLYLIRNLKFFFVGALFLPGSFFYDIRGEPIDRFQLAALNRVDRTGFLETRIPNFGTDPAIMYNIGAEFRF